LPRDGRRPQVQSRRGRAGRIEEETSMFLTSNPDATVTFTVNTYASVTQGIMSTKTDPPDVVTAVQDNSGRVSKMSNGSFEVSGSAAQGNPLVLQFEVLPADAYAIVGVIIQNLSGVSEGGTPWDTIIIGSGASANKMTLRDVARKPTSASSIDYEIYLLIKPKQAATNFPVGDYGLIDPVWTNR
jgi:hypothetical protein